MAKISINRPHKLSHGKAKEAAELLAADLHRKFSLRYEWEGDHIEFHRPGLSGRLRVAPEELHLHVELGFLLAGFRGSIENEIHRQLDEILGPHEVIEGEAVRVAETPKSKAKSPAAARKSATPKKPAEAKKPDRSHVASGKPGGKRAS